MLVGLSSLAYTLRSPEHSGYHNNLDEFGCSCLVCLSQDDVRERLSEDVQNVTQQLWLALELGPHDL